MGTPFLIASCDRGDRQLLNTQFLYDTLPRFKNKLLMCERTNDKLEGAVATWSMSEFGGIEDETFL